MTVPVLPISTLIYGVTCFWPTGITCCQELAALRQQLDRWSEALAANDAEALQQMMQAAAAKRKELDTDADDYSSVRRKNI